MPALLNLGLQAFSGNFASLRDDASVGSRYVRQAIVDFEAEAEAMSARLRDLGADASAKMLTTPTHISSTMTAAYAGGKPRNTESIYAGNAIYVNVGGKWSRSKMTPQDMLTMQQDWDQRQACCQWRNQIWRDWTIEAVPAYNLFHDKGCGNDEEKVG